MSDEREGHPARARRPRPLRQSRRRQSAGLSRLDDRLPHPRRARGSRAHALRGHPLRPPGHAHHVRPGTGGGGAGRRLARHRRPLGTGRDHHQPAGVPEDRRSPADGRYRLRPGAPILRRDAEGSRRRDDLLRSPRRPGTADSRQHQGRVSGEPRLADPGGAGRAEGRGRRTRGRRPVDPRQHLERRPLASARSATASTSRSRRRPSTSSAIRTSCWG